MPGIVTLPVATLCFLRPSIPRAGPRPYLRDFVHSLEKAGDVWLYGSLPLHGPGKAPGPGPGPSLRLGSPRNTANRSKGRGGALRVRCVPHHVIHHLAAQAPTPRTSTAGVATHGELGRAGKDGVVISRLLIKACSAFAMISP